MRGCLLLAVLVGTMIAGSATCQPFPDEQSAEAHAVAGNADIVVRLDSERRIVSGTNSRLALYADVLLLPGEQPDAFDDWSVMSATCTIRGEPVALTSVAPAKPYVRQVRFASNHFTNGGLPVEFHVVIGLHQNDGPLPYTQIVDMGTLSISLRALNNAFVYGSRVLENGLDPLGVGPTFESNSRQVQHAGAVLESVNYDVQPAALLRLEVERSDLAHSIRDNSVLYAATHGDPSGICDSTGVDDGHVLRFAPSSVPNVHQEVQAKGARPVYDFVFLYSCAVLGGPAAPEAAFFGGQSYQGRALFGFEEPIVTYAYQKAKEGQPVSELTEDKENVGLLADQAEVLMDELVNGTRAGDAMDRANLDWKSVYFDPVTANPKVHLVPLSLRGDALARLKWVYLDPQDWVAEDPNARWYIVK